MRNQKIQIGQSVTADYKGGSFKGKVTEIGSRGWLVVSNGKDSIKVRSTKITIKSPRRTLAQQIRKYVDGYIYETNASGTRSKICGDDVSLELAALPLTAVWDKVTKELPNVDWEGKRQKWAKLNDGQIRMCLGNMWRAELARQAEVEDSDSTFRGVGNQ